MTTKLVEKYGNPSSARAMFGHIGREQLLQTVTSMQLDGRDRMMYTKVANLGKYRNGPSASDFAGLFDQELTNLAGVGPLAISVIDELLPLALELYPAPAVGNHYIAE